MLGCCPTVCSPPGSRRAVAKSARSPGLVLGLGSAWPEESWCQEGELERCAPEAGGSAYGRGTGDAGPRPVHPHLQTAHSAASRPLCTRHSCCCCCCCCCGTASFTHLLLSSLGIQTIQGGPERLVRDACRVQAAPHLARRTASDGSASHGGRRVHAGRPDATHAGPAPERLGLLARTGTSPPPLGRLGFFWASGPPFPPPVLPQHDKNPRSPRCPPLSPPSPSLHFPALPPSLVSLSILSAFLLRQASPLSS